MKHLRFSFYLGMLLLMVLAACGPQATPTATDTATSAPAAQQPSETPTLVAVPTEAPATATLTPVVLAGPEMAVGSQYPYVDGTVLIAVPAGPFTMGRSGGTNNPEHQVTLPDFWIYSTKVTNQQYARCVSAGQCTIPDLQDNQAYNDYARLNEPVVGVNYDQAAAYCVYIHGRLPTEAEWEKTARGPDANIYPWGNGAPSKDLLNYNNNVGHTTNVVQYGPGASYYGGLDLEGNSFEWVADWYDDLYYKKSPADNPLGPDAGQARSIRSSSYKSNSDQTPASTRFFDFPNHHRRDLGFRCVVEDPTYFAPLCEQVSFYAGAPGGNGNPGGDITATCPNLSINVQPLQCDSNKTNVTFKSDDPAAIFGGVGTCIDGGGGFPGSHVFTCSSATTATLDGVCTFSSLGQAQCPAHYVLDSGTGMCNWDGTGSSGQNCLPNQNYDPVNQCCTDSTGNNSFPLCQAGSVMVDLGGGKYGCLANQAAPPPPHLSSPVTMPPACGGPGGCNKNANSCISGFNAAKCCCIYYDPGCTP